MALGALTNGGSPPPKDTPPGGAALSHRCHHPTGCGGTPIAPKGTQEVPAGSPLPPRGWIRAGAGCSKGSLHTFGVQCRDGIYSTEWEWCRSVTWVTLHILPAIPAQELPHSRALLGS